MLRRKTSFKDVINGGTQAQMEPECDPKGGNDELRGRHARKDTAKSSTEASAHDRIQIPMELYIGTAIMSMQFSAWGIVIRRWITIQTDYSAGSAGGRALTHFGFSGVILPESPIQQLGFQKWL